VYVAVEYHFLNAFIALKYMSVSTKGYGGGMLDCIIAQQPVHISWRL